MRDVPRVVIGSEIASYMYERSITCVIDSGKERRMLREEIKSTVIYLLLFLINILAYAVIRISRIINLNVKNIFGRERCDTVDNEMKLKRTFLAN